MDPEGNICASGTLPAHDFWAPRQLSPAFNEILLQETEPAHECAPVANALHLFYVSASSR